MRARLTVTLAGVALAVLAWDVHLLGCLVG